MRILGLDPGIRCTGYGLITIDRREPSLEDYGIITPPPDVSMGERLSVLYDDLAKLIGTNKPDEFAIETTFYGINVKSALILGQAKGVALLCAARHGLPTAEYAPRKVKLATTGNGQARKEQVQFMVQRILGMDHIPQPMDASDALAVAICHHQQRTLLNADLSTEVQGG
ncbi:MAG: crossover junction endodeoxyribonuclease RuvC [Fidelibacterota bacterium]|nr:MAG: crossover junction endodeoxyribonuclease RuvC [Candidatus Neomarinimicrobiota bacterium]